MRKLFLIVMIILPASLAAQNGIKLTNLVVSDGSPAMVTFDVSWAKADMPSLWSDTVWVFVDYNKNDKMTRLELSTGATLTATSAPGVGEVIEVPGNDQGVWIVGDARTNGSFSATVQLRTATADLAGACVYGSNYPPVVNYNSEDASQISFTGTPVYSIVMERSGETYTVYSDGSHKIFPGEALRSFTDATGAPGYLNCVPMVGNIGISVPANVPKGQPVSFGITGGMSTPATVSYIWTAPDFGPASGLGTAYAPTAPASAGMYPVTLTARSTGYCDRVLTHFVSVMDCLPSAMPDLHNLTVSNTAYCTGSTVTFVLSNTTLGRTYRLYKGSDAVMDVLPGTGAAATFTGTFAGPGIYTAQVMAEMGNCAAAMNGVHTVSENPLPSAPTGASSNAHCGSGTVTFSATVPSGHTIDWYTTSNGTTLVSGGGSVTSISPSLTATTTYHAQARNTTTGCVSATRTAVTATVNSVPGAPSISGSSSYCTSGTITATYGNGGTGIRWTDGGSGSTTATRTITASGTYYAVSTNAAGCTSTSTSKVVTIVLPGTSGSSATACDCASGLTKCADNICRTGCPPTQVSTCPNGQECMLTANNTGIDGDWGVSSCANMTPWGWGMSCYEIAVERGASYYVWDGTTCRICK